MRIILFVAISLLAIGKMDSAFGQTEDAKPSVYDFKIRGVVLDDTGKPQVEAVVQTVGIEGRPTYKTKTLGNGGFLLSVPADGHYGPNLLITSVDGSLSSFISGFDYDTRRRKPFVVKLLPWREVEVRVRDGKNNPVPGAEIVLQAAYQDIANAKTAETGVAKLRFPANAKVDWINALKDGVGYDYYENYDKFPTRERLEVPDKIELVLDGATPVEVLVQDSQGNPIADVTVAPWTIKKPAKLSSANVGGALNRTTDQNGKAVFAWLPKNLDKGVTILPYHEDYHCPAPGHVVPDENGAQVVLNMLKNAVIRGKVVYPNGTPAAGIRLQGEGRGDTNFYFRGHTKSDENGEFEIKVYPNQNILLATTDPDYAASVSGINLAEGEVENVEIKLSEGVLIHGRLSVGKDNQPAPEQTATLIQEGGGASLVRWSTSDQKGEYSFRVGPGTYTLSAMDQSTVKLRIAEDFDQKNVVHDFNIAQLPEQP
ncbi:MAG: hypothetical protein AAF483_14330 [Planctomycetota bacterium]